VSKRRLVVAGAVLALWLVPVAAEGQGVLQRARERAQQRVEERTERGIEKAVDVAEQAIACVATDAACIEGARASGQDVVVTDAGGKPLPAAQQPAAAPVRVGGGAWANYDFVPGERVLFHEDFTQDRVGNFPRRLELLTGSAEVVEWNGRRWLRMNDYTAFRVALPEALPERFTVEMELPIPWHRMGFYSEKPDVGGQYHPGGHRTSAVVVSGTEVGVYRNAGTEGTSTVDPRRLFGEAMFDEQSETSHLTVRPYWIRLHVDGSYIKMYVDERRVANLPNGSFGRERFLVVEFDGMSWGGLPLLASISVNAGGLPMYDALMADGRVSTQGILFATGSDRIRPESTPTLKEIGEMLRAHPELRLRIEGHTDNVGDAATNEALSQRRAAAVRDHLIGEFGISAARLEAQGLGASRPAGTNDTPEGRQANRRVELVRL
jgi:OmpA-OmpF porin, OOP family